MLCSWFKSEKDFALLLFLFLFSLISITLNSFSTNHFSSLWGKEGKIVGDLFFKSWHHLFVMEQECWKQHCVSLSQQREITYLIWLYTPTSSLRCLSPLAVIRGMQDVCDHAAVSLRLSPTPNTVEGTDWFQLNWRNRQKFQDTEFPHELNSVAIRHWVICREKTVKCHPAAQRVASVSLTSCENKFYGLSYKVFWFFSI